MPPTVEVVAECASAYLTKAVLFRDVFGFEDNVFQGKVNRLIGYLVNRLIV
jgi:hypothetical protein